MFSNLFRGGAEAAVHRLHEDSADDWYMDHKDDPIVQFMHCEDSDAYRKMIIDQTPTEIIAEPTFEL